MSYFGAKTRLVARIVSVLPAHNSYVEPFAGSMAVLMAKPRAGRIEIANDIDQDLMTFWRVLRDQPDELARLCTLTPHSRAEYAAAWPIPADVSDLERARRVWVKLAQGRGGQLRPTGWRHHRQSHGRHSSLPATLLGYVDRFGFAAQRLLGVSLECLPALEVIDKYAGDPDTLLYVDPPYLAGVRMPHAYQHEMMREAEHRDLADALHRSRAAVVLSGYPSALYDELYAGWSRVDLDAFTGQGTTTRAAGQRTEVLWSNRPLPTRGT